MSGGTAATATERTGPPFAPTPLAGGPAGPWRPPSAGGAAAPAGGRGAPRPVDSRIVLRRGEREPIEPVPGQCQEVRQLADLRERPAAGELVGVAALPRRQVQLHRLREAGHVVDAEHGGGRA